MTVDTAPELLDLTSANSPDIRPFRPQVDMDAILSPAPRPEVAISSEQANVFDVAQGLKIPVTFADPNLPDTPLVFANRAFEYLTGYRSSVLIGSNCRFLQGPETSRAEVAKIRQAVEERRRCDVVLVNYKANGDAFHSLVVIRPIWLNNDQCLLMGSQYEFNFGARRREIESDCYSRFDHAEEMSLKLRNLATTARTSLLARSEAAAVHVEHSILRRRVGL